ncbi:DUF1343 domain-containing protein, partial [bacterium]|nr:DUF1343 domain-containing protein [bacterium]
VQIHFTDFKKHNAFEMGVELMATLWKLYPEQCQWKQPPYEYVEDQLPIDVIAGTDQFRKAVESGKTQPFLERSEEELTRFKKLRKQYLLY